MDRKVYQLFSFVKVTLRASMAARANRDWRWITWLSGRMSIRRDDRDNIDLYDGVLNSVIITDVQEAIRDGR